MSNHLKKLLALGVSCFCIAMPLKAQTSEAQAVQVSRQSFNSWKQMQSDSGKCRISFPQVPEHLQQSMMLPEDNSEMKYDVFISGLDQQAVYMVLIAEYPTNMNEQYAEMSLQAFMNGILNQNPHNRLIFADLVTVDGYKALDFFIRTHDVYFKARAFIAHNQLYLLAMECEAENYIDEDFNYFIKSFQFVK